MRFSFEFATILGVSLISPWLGLSASAQASSTQCGSVFNTTADFILAEDAYQCLITAPFNKTLATNLLAYWSETLEFQSTLSYLKDPPPAYQRSSVDVLNGLNWIQDQVNDGVFTNHYSFEASVQSLLQRTHDGHVGLQGGLLDVFLFVPNIVVASVSADGFSLPMVYDASELWLWYYGYIDTAPSPIVAIDGADAGLVLAAYGARSSFGALEAHGDWNQMMWSPARGIQDYIPLSTPFYQGSRLDITFDNGTVASIDWHAVYVGGETPLINTGQDLYDWFVLNQDTVTDIEVNGEPTDSTATDTVDSIATVTTAATAADATDTDDSAPALTSVSSSPTSTAGPGGAYPDPADVVQQDYGQSGWVSGYLLRDTKLGVLSIPSFEVAQTTWTVQEFSDAIQEFLNKSKAAGMEKILIDLQQNYGGEQILASEAFKQFFPNIEPFSGMRTRSFDLADQLGSIVTADFEQHYGTDNETLVSMFINDPWAVTNEINAGTGQNFSSWQEYYGPHPDRGDAFSTIFRYNFSNPIFLLSAGDVENFDNETLPTSPPYDAKDIVILTDSACASTCDLFVEMMHHQAGVRTIVIGGLPQEGPMQARGSSRGALELANWQVDANLAFAASLNNTISPALLNRDSDLAETYLLTFNFADQIREGENVPLQFTYEAADCRIFWTPDTLFNYTLLWNYAASATFYNASTCVARSAEHNNTMQTNIWGPSKEQLDSWAATNPSNTPPNLTMTATQASNQIDFWIGINLDGPIIHTAWDRASNNFGAGGPNTYVRPPPNKKSPQIGSRAAYGPGGFYTNANLFQGPYGLAPGTQSHPMLGSPNNAAAPAGAQAPVGGSQAGEAAAGEGVPAGARRRGLRPGFGHRGTSRPGRRMRQAV